MSGSYVEHEVDMKLSECKGFQVALCLKDILEGMAGKCKITDSLDVWGILEGVDRRYEAFVLILAPKVKKPGSVTARHGISRHLVKVKQQVRSTEYCGSHGLSDHKPVCIRDGRRTSRGEVHWGMPNVCVEP